MDDDGLLLCCFCKELMTDPVQLGCLHNCCCRCADDAATKQGSRAIKCRQCNDVTDIAVKNRNSYIDGRVHIKKLSGESVQCGFCASVWEREPGDEWWWCRECFKPLCDDCFPGHKKFNADHMTRGLQDISSTDDMALAYAETCQRHKRAYDRVCTDCKTIKCEACGTACEEDRHTLQLISRRENRSIATSIETEINHFESMTTSKSELIDKHKSLMSHLGSARRAGLNALVSNKTRALEAIDRAYSSGEKVLNECYDWLSMQAATLMAEVELLDKSAHDAVGYGKLLTSPERHVVLRQQYHTLVSRLQSFTNRFRKIMPLDTEKLVVVDSILPKNLDDVAAAWVGRPRLVIENTWFCAGQTNDSPSSDISCSDCTDATRSSGDSPNSMECSLLHLSATSQDVDLPVSCYDMAITSSGHLLLATAAHGLKEYDASGIELSSWSPPKRIDGSEEDVVTVDVTDDGRVAVGLKSSLCVVLLKPGSVAAWVEEKRITSPRSPPYRIATFADVLAVSEGRLGESVPQMRSSCSLSSALRPSPHLLVASMYDGRELIRMRLDYDVISVAVTARAVICASYGSVKTEDGCELRVVESYGHDGSLLWRRSGKENVCDMSAARWEGVLYVALRGSSSTTASIMALSDGDGRLLSVVLSGDSHALREPFCLSVSRGQPVRLAVLSPEWLRSAVTVYLGTWSEKATN